MKEFLTDTLELDRFFEETTSMKRNVIRNRDLSKLKKENKNFKNNFFLGKIVKPERPESEFTSLDKVRIVVDSLVDESKVKKICRRERISLDTFNKWKKDFLEAFDRYSDELTDSEKMAALNTKLILKETSQEVLDFFNEYVDTSFPGKNLVIPSNEKLASYSKFYAIKNVFILNKMNNFRMINKYLEEINQNLPLNGLLMGSFETFSARYRNNKISKIPVVKNLYFGFEFIFNRVIPKLPYFKKLYFSITKGRNRALSKAESLGRLVSCGFDIVDFKEIDGMHYFVAKKIKAPSYDMNASYGPLFKMKRVGKNGKIIGVYKFRTMHPYSEYLQDYVLKLNGYASSGKPADDFRIVPWGKFLRRYWLDELPQLINLFKGELKLVGARPVSQRYFQDIPADIQELRLSQKPGCIPPYVALNRNSSVDAVLEAEKEYLLEKRNKPYYTDTKYFFSALFNIVFKNKRSA